MNEFYPAIKQLHVACVLLSGTLFAGRGALMCLKSPLANHRRIRHVTYINDTVLLAAGVALIMMTRQYPGEQLWLLVKLVLLVAYIILGVFALRRGRSYRIRVGCLLAAIGVYLFMYSIARAHHPAGALLML